MDAKSVNLKQECKSIEKIQMQVYRNRKKVNYVCLCHLMQVVKQCKTVQLYKLFIALWKLMCVMWSCDRG